MSYGNMGRAVVYCFKCGRQLVSSDFYTKAAFYARDGTICAGCLGLDEPLTAEASEAPRGSTTRIRLRRRAEAKRHLPLLLGAATLLLGLGGYLLFAGSSRNDPAPLTRPAESILITTAARVAKEPLPAPPPVVERPKGWQSIFDGASPRCLSLTSRIGWEVRDGALRAKQGQDHVGQTQEQFEEGEVRIRFEQQGLELLYFGIRQSLDGRHAVHLDAVLLGTAEGPRELLFSCRGDIVTAMLDGRVVPAVALGRSKKGHLQFFGRGGTYRILSIDRRD